MQLKTNCNHSWFRTTKNYKPAWKCYNCGEVSLTKKKRYDKDNKETMIYPFTEDALIKLRGLLFFGETEKIAIALPNDAAPYLIVDHTQYVLNDEPTLSGKTNIVEEKKRTVIQFDYIKPIK